MLQPIKQIEQSIDPPTGYFYDHLQNELYLVKEGKIQRKSLKSGKIQNVPIAFHLNQNNQKIFPVLFNSNGNAKFNVQRTIATTENDNECIIRTDNQIYNGSSWQWHVPSSLNNVKLGFVEITKNLNVFKNYFNLNSSSARTVSFICQNNQITCSVNGSKKSKKHTKKIVFDQEKQSKFYPMAQIFKKEQTIIFNPFGMIQKNSYEFTKNFEQLKAETKQSQNSKIKKITQLDENRILITNEQGQAKIVLRDSFTNKFDFPSISINGSSIKGLFSEKEFQILKSEELWSLSYSQTLDLQTLCPLIQNSLKSLRQSNLSYTSYKILLEKLLILRSLDSRFTLKNLVYESQLDRQIFSQTISGSYFNLPKNPLVNISKSKIQNNKGWTTIQGKIEDITQNYLMSIQDENVIIYHLGEEIKEIFRQNIIFFEFNKNTFLERYNQNDLRLLKKVQTYSSIYKILQGCFSKNKTTRNSVYQIKQSDLKQLIHDYKISESDAKLSLQQAGSVEQALVWLSKDQNERTYIQKPHQTKSKHNQQQKIRGSLLELKQDNIVKLILHINQSIYLLGYDPETFSNYISRGQKQFINLNDFSRVSSINKLQSSSWYKYPNHKNFTVIDFINLKSGIQFLFTENGSIYACKKQNLKILKSKIEFNSLNIYESQFSINYSSFESFDQNINMNSITRSINGQLFYEDKLKSQQNQIIVHNNKVYSNLSNSIEQKVIIDVLIDENNFIVEHKKQKQQKPEQIPLLIITGPPGVNSHYQISSILSKSSPFLANYPQKVILKSIHSKYIQVSSLTIQRLSEHKNTNQVKGGIVYFKNQSGLESKRYQYTFEKVNDKIESKKQVMINEKSCWKYMIVQSLYENDSKQPLPYEIGYISVKGYTMQTQNYKQLVIKAITNSIQLVPKVNYQCENYKQLSNKSLRIELVIEDSLNNDFNIKTNNMLSEVFSINTINLIKENKNINEIQQINALKKLQVLDSKQLIRLFSVTKNPIAWLKQIVKKQKFTFNNFDAITLNKFIDIALHYSESLKSENAYILFTKLYSSQSGKKYMTGLFSDSGKCQTNYPLNFIRYMIEKTDSTIQIQNLKDLLSILPTKRSNKYSDLRAKKIPYLLLEDTFYSSYYLDLIEKSNRVKSTTSQKIPIFQEQLFIPCQFVSMKDEISKKIYLKMNKNYQTDKIILRLDKSQSTSRINFKIYSHQTNKLRKLIQSGKIHEYQWNQITKSENNVFTIDLISSCKSEFLQIQLLYNETGLNHSQSESNNSITTDIIPQVYGHKLFHQPENVLNSIIQDQIHKLFNFTNEESFYLSTVDIGYCPMQKYSITKQNQYEYSYFKPFEEKTQILKRNIQQKIQSKDYSSAISDHKKLVNSFAKLSKQPALDYIFTLLTLTLQNLFYKKTIIDQNICKILFDHLIKQEVGPIRISAFKVASHSVTYLIKSLPFLQEQGYFPNLDETILDHKEIQQMTDLKNVPLCVSLNKLIVNSMSYQKQWALLLIKMSSVTQKYQQIIRFILKSDSWLNVSEITKFFSQIPLTVFTNVLLANLNSNILQKFILQLKKLNLTSRLHFLIDRLINIHEGKINFEIVNLMLAQKNIKWHHLYKLIKKSPQAQKLIITQFLTNKKESQIFLAKKYPQIINQASKSINNQNLLTKFLNKIIETDKNVFKKVILNLPEDSSLLTVDMYSVLSKFLIEQCNYGGIQGSKILTEEDLQNLQTAQVLIKKITPFSSQNLVQNELFIQWYFLNNSYEYFTINPVNKSPGMIIMKSLSEKVLNLIRNYSIKKVLQVFDRLIESIQTQHIPLSIKHIYTNQINQGVSTLLGKSISPESLGQVLIDGSNNQMIKRIFQSLQSKKDDKNTEYNTKQNKNCKQISLVQNFATQTSVKDKIKGWDSNQNGSKNVLFKLPITEKSIFMKCSEPEGFILSKIIIGFTVSDNTQKNNLLPQSVEVYGGQNKQNLVKICELKAIQDQHYSNFDVKIFGVNFNSIAYRQYANPLHAIEFRIQEPLLTSLSDSLQNNQKNKKDAFYAVSFICLLGYESQPKTEPFYSQIYMTLLSFLHDPKYIKTLNQMISSSYFQNNSKRILKLLNQLLPNKQIEKLILALNRQSQDVLGSILENVNPNIQLIKSLMQTKITCENIKKILQYFLDNPSEKISQIIIETIKIYSYQNNAKEVKFQVKKLIALYQKNISNNPIFKVLISIISSPKIFNFNYEALLEYFWTQSNNKSSSYLQLIGSTIAYYPESLNQFLSSKKSQKVVNQLISLLNQKTSDVYSHIYLVSQLSIHNKNRQFFIQNNYPIRIVESLRNQQTLLNKNQLSSMKYFILFFQQTCIQTSCQQRFAQILIQLMVKLPQISSLHHNFFIHQFFFPLINAFKGIPVKFVWKNSSGNYLSQATKCLINKPIRTNQNILVIDGNYIEKVEHNDVSKIQNENKYLFINKQGKVFNIQNKTQKVSNQLQLYRKVKQEISNLLTNQTLIKAKNISIFGGKYQNSIPIQDSTFENIFYLPSQMTLTDILKQMNFSGYRLNNKTIESVQFTNYSNNQSLIKNKTLEQIFNTDASHNVIIQLNPEYIFEYTTIQEICRNQVSPHVFIPQQTIFKAFEKKQGLIKMITVLKTCVKNWNNAEQSKIWQQYLKQLQSFSCFPIFSSMYMNKQQNVQLLFNILSGLPDKQDSKKWIQIQKNSVKFLYNIIKDVFQVQGQKAIQIRKYALQHHFYQTMLGRLHLVSKQSVRYKVDQVKQQQQLIVPTKLDKKISQDDYKLKVVKKKGIGYGNDSSSNQKWDITTQQQTRKQVSTQILSLLKIIEKFIDHKSFNPPKQILQASFESALLPILESSLRGGSLLQISKSAQLFKGQLQFVKAISKKKSLIPLLINIPKIYEPKQHESIFELLKVLESTSKIFLSCLTGSVGQKLSEEIAKGIIDTYQLVQQAVSNYNIDHIDEEAQKRILQLPLAKKYPLLLKDLRFDYIEMKDKNGKITKHHYSSNFIANHKSPATKTIRLAQQLADISHALPVEHTNAIYVRCDKQRVDFMQALIMGSNGTPYGHGAYLFDIYFDDTYPNNPPKVNLTTTGNGQIRFNPNLYSCGKVCLSLLGTWRGSAMENWDPKVSTLLQILVSIQSIIMAEQVYFNQPGFQHQQGTIQGEKKNQAYANIVRYGNIKYAMIQNMKNPPKGFQHVIRRHFYLKKDQILEQTKKWLKYAQKRQASYTGLVSDHNHNWCNTFKKSKNQYKNMLQKAITQLETQLNKLPQPSNKDLKTLNSPKKQKKNKKVIIQSKDQNIQEIDVTYDKINLSNNLKQMDINDQKVKDRWSRYIGAMGLEAVNKQSKANILLFGLGATGVQIAKNIILSGCKKISISDDKNVQITDLAGQFFLTEEELGKNRVQSCLYKLQQLNHYVRVQNLKFSEENLQVLKSYDVVILTEQSLSKQKLINSYCHKNGIKFIITDCYGPFGQHFNDFGANFEVLDKNGEQTVEVMIQNITNAEKGLVTLLNKQRHPYEDGQAVRINGVKGMVKENGESINGTIHKIKVINQFSFEIGDTREYSDYQIDGVARNMKLPIKVQFKSLQQSLEDLNIDGNLAFYDFEKSTKNYILHKCFIALSNFRQKNLRSPKPWNYEDGQLFIELVKQVYKQQLKPSQLSFIRTFSYTCTGSFAPIAAFYGGLTAQQTFKAITGKYMPVNQYFFIQFTQVIPTIPQNSEQLKKYLNKLNYQQSKEKRKQGLRRVIGDQLNEEIEKCRVFLIGSGAIGCELLKNYAMINLATSQNGGQIIVTDPDHIEESNLNRQFLFRQKHLRKPKSVTAAAAVAQMNKLLKGKIRAKLDRVCQSTKDIFSNEFFESLNIVTNALDNVKARQYVDQRCVQNKVALLESGTLSSKGHVQVIIPYQTQTYGSKNDPAEQGEIPHCTLKMFPEETLHCVQWARDIFGKTFTLDPKALSKLVQKQKQYSPNPSDLQMLKSCLKIMQIKPKNFDEAVFFATNKFFELYRNDICQLLYTYPLDAKTKDGKPFWKLPKRPPTPIYQLEPSNELHSTFITSYAVLLCKVFNISYPIDFRKQQKREQICKMASKIKISEFAPNDKLAKQMAQQVDKSQQKTDNENKQLQSINEIQTNQQQSVDEVKIFNNITTYINDSINQGLQLKVNAEQFEKDDDQNGHIDLIYSMANLRASNYKLQPMDWMTTKLKAGRITPALSTTTSCVAALQTIQLIKYLKKCKLDKMRNTFINLAVPMIQAGQPGEVQKIKVHEQLTTNIWQRWQVGPLNLQNLTIGQFLQTIEFKYKINVKILTILQGAQIYSDLVLGLESKKEEKQSLMKKQLKQILITELTAQQMKKFIDFTLVFSVKDEIAKHVPTLRLLLN